MEAKRAVEASRADRDIGERLVRQVDALVEDLVSWAFVLTIAATALTSLLLLFSEPGNGLDGVLVGLALLGLSGAGLRWRRMLRSLVDRRPWLVLAPAVLSLVAIWIDGASTTTYLTVTYVGIGVASVLGRPGWACAAAGLLVAGYVTGVLVDGLPAEGVARRQALEFTLTNASYYLVVPLAVAVPVWACARFVRDVPRILDEVRSAELRPLPSGPRELAPVDELQELTPAERQVVDRLGAGLTPKAIALDLERSIGTVRTHLKHAKRKTGARTLDQLAAIAARARQPPP